MKAVVTPAANIPGEANTKHPQRDDKNNTKKASRQDDCLNTEKDIVNKTKVEEVSTASNAQKDVSKIVPDSSTSGNKIVNNPKCQSEGNVSENDV